MRSGTAKSIFSSVVVGLLVGLPALAGPLDPPSGPIAPTPGPEPRTAINATNTPGDANSLFRITQPGSYYLTGNVTGTAGFSGIDVAGSAGPVTIDLNGFTLKGVAGSLDGINNEGTTVLVVRNGTATGWGVSGVEGTRIEDVQATGNGGTGIFCSDRSIVVRCVANNNGASGSGSGIVTGLSSLVSDCAALSNGGTGGGSGISTGSSCRVERCIVSANGTTSTGVNSSWGISVGSDSSVVDCRVQANGSLSNTTNSGGIFVSLGGEVRQCMLYSNRNFGVLGSGEGVFIGNKIQSVTGAVVVGLFVNGTHSRIEDNHVFDSTTGIKVASTGNVIIRNSCRGNTTNFDIAASNDVGPIGAAATATSPFANVQGN